MKLPIKTLLSLFSLACVSSSGASETLHYKAEEGKRLDKHLVLLANDHEYRSEESLPALARILTVHHGFDTTVVFGLDEKGHIKAGSNHMPGLQVLEKADALIIFARFLDLPDRQMKHIDTYLKRGGPVVGMRTSTHAFKIAEKSNSSFKSYSFRHKSSGYKGGFGEQVLGQSWVGHYGKNHVQSTRIDLIENKSKHPILIGVNDVWVQAGGYNAEPQPDWEVLAMAQPLLSMKPDGKDDPKKPAMAGHWTRHYHTSDGKKHRVVTSLYGASEDLLNQGYRRLMVNSVYWSLGMESKILAESKVDLVGPYHPTTFKMNGYRKNIKPSDYQALDSPIPAKQ